MTTINLAPEWSSLRGLAPAGKPEATGQEESALARIAPPSAPAVAVRQMRPGAYQAYVPASVQEAAQMDQAVGPPRKVQTHWTPATGAPGSTLDVKA